MGSYQTALAGVLRAQLTAVHQQFVHILALRQWGMAATASRIMEVDRIDFPITMKIIDHMVASSQPVDLEPEPFTPGSSEAEILAAESRVDARLHAALLAARMPECPVAHLIAEALAPRQSYAGWLSDRIGAFGEQAPSGGKPANEPASALAKIFSFNIVLIEQSMVHAFVHWHHGDRADADSAWATSGAAMMHSTAIVRWLAARNSAPLADNFPPLRLSGHPDKAIEFDRHLAGSFESCLANLFDRKNESATDLYTPIRDYARNLSGWKPGRDHPAKQTNPPAFQSFEKTLAKFVWT